MKGGRGGGKMGGGGGKGGPGTKGPIKKKAYRGLDVLERGQSKFSSSKVDEAKQKSYAEHKRKAAYAKLLEQQKLAPLDFGDRGDQELDPLGLDAGMKAAGKKEKGGKGRGPGGGGGGKGQVGGDGRLRDDFDGMDLDGGSDEGDSDGESLSDGSFEFSDEDVGDGEITFKDPSVQKLWGGAGGGGKAQAGGGGGSKKGKKEGGGGKGGKGGGEGMFEVPNWGEDGKKARADGPKGKEGKKGAGKKAKPNPFGKVAGEAEARRRAEEEEREKLEREREEARKGRQAYFKERKKDKAMHMKKTKSGQPVMKNMIDGMLKKLQSD